MNNQDCFGSFKERSKDCDRCDCAEACQFAKADNKQTKEIDRSWNDRKGRRSYIEGLEGEDNSNLEEVFKIMDLTYIPDSESEEKKYTDSDMVDYGNLIIELCEDDRVHKVLKERMKDFDPLAKIGRRHGHTRQHLRDRIGKELSRILGYQTNRIKRDFKALLTKSQYEVFRLRKEQDFSFAEIAKKTNRSESAIYKMSKRISKKLGIEFQNK